MSGANGTPSAREDLADLVRRGGTRAWGWPRLPVATDEHRRTLRPSAVLVLARPVADDTGILLVRRSAAMRYHPGQFAFPGGGIDPGEDAVGAALRETEEETGLRVEESAVVGTLPPLALLTSNNVVTPVLAWTDEPVGAPDGDVAATPRVLDAETHSTHWATRSRLGSADHRVTATYAGRWAGPGFLLDDSVVWGFTAIVLDWLLDGLRWSRPWDTTRRHVIE